MLMCLTEPQALPPTWPQALVATEVHAPHELLQVARVRDGPQLGTGTAAVAAPIRCRRRESRQGLALQLSSLRQRLCGCKWSAVHRLASETEAHTLASAVVAGASCRAAGCKWALRPQCRMPHLRRARLRNSRQAAAPQLRRHALQQRLGRTSSPPPLLGCWPLSCCRRHGCCCHCCCPLHSWGQRGSRGWQPGRLSPPQRLHAS